MGFKHQVFTLICDGNKAEIKDAIDDMLAGVNFKMWYLSLDNEETGPEAPDAPAINAPLEGNCSVTTPNFNAIEGVTYVLEYTDDNWSTVSTLVSSCGPNETTPTTYTATRSWRITAYDTTGTVHGQPTTLIP